MYLLDLECWIFDMDGTLTVAQHDFDALRLALGLPANQPILETLDKMPPAQAKPLREKLDLLELDIAGNSRPGGGVRELLDSLRERNAKLGILTRNNLQNTRKTLEAAGLAHYFADEYIVTRDRARPKPDPEGILYLLETWGKEPSQAVMVGDYLFDLQAGRAAGTATVYLDTRGLFPFRRYADLSIKRLDDLLRY